MTPEAKRSDDEYQARKRKNPVMRHAAAEFELAVNSITEAQTWPLFANALAAAAVLTEAQLQTMTTEQWGSNILSLLTLFGVDDARMDKMMADIRHRGALLAAN